jgi:hypothetical protein
LKEKRNHAKTQAQCRSRKQQQEKPPQQEKPQSIRSRNSKANSASITGNDAVARATVLSEIKQQQNRKISTDGVSRETLVARLAALLHPESSNGNIPPHLQP